MNNTSSFEMSPEWKPLVEVVAAMLTLAPEFVVLQTYDPRFSGAGPYVQSLREDDGGLTIEAASNDFLDHPLTPQSMRTLLDLGWSEPVPASDMPNYWMFLEGHQVVPGQVADFLVRTLRDAYQVTTAFSFEMAPTEVFVEIASGQFGSPPSLGFSLGDLRGWTNPAN